ncbi:hypothetical protein [Nocardioides sp. Leaf307]|uniref:hypothetical protein n=1 Tax=Nocardioides sp. Leaf307 TaxID=1736331 RepID=UPI000702C320|nr:hypothetical protein [Nocardioides sp. Leaf307]KQQ42945.1 hypothetical protein ASF50_02720 [Nocardioides sp. Leaf307]
MFGPGSEWRRQVGEAPVAADSEELVDQLASQVEVRYGGVAAFNDGEYNVAYYRVPPGQPRVDVSFDDCQGKGYTPSELTDPAVGGHFLDVPVPEGAVPAAGADGELTVHDPAADQLWELWKARRVDGVWHACWGGRLDDVSASPGFFPGYTGVAATGLSVTGGAIGLAEVRAGRIDHALSLNVVDAAHFTTYSYPAQRSDGNLPLGAPAAIEEGRRFRLDPALDLDTLDLHPIARLVADAAQRYGFIVNDRAGAVSVIAERGPAFVDAWAAARGDTPGYGVMAGFPWRSLHALPPDYGALE